MHWWTSASRSGKASRANGGRMPVSASIWAFTSSSRKVSIPQSVWWMRMISFVPSSRWERTIDRIASSVTTPPALRTTCASPSDRPSTPQGLSRASMHASTSTCEAGTPNPSSARAEAVDQVLMQLPQPLWQVLAEHHEELGHPVRLQLPLLGVHREQQVQVGL